MDDYSLKALWQDEEDFAFQGWDFSHINGRWESEDLAWDYKEILLSHLKSADKLLDMGTGGGEFLLSLKHPFALTTVTEAYRPNVQLCKERLAPLGIEVVQIEEDDILPFEGNSFDMVVNKHESFDPAEVARVLKKGGYFITQQVGGKNNWDLAQHLIPDFIPEPTTHDLAHSVDSLRKLGFEIQFAEEAFPPIRFFDVGALVYFAKIIEWEFPGFSVDSSFEALCECQKEIQEKGFIQGTEHRFVIVAKR